MSTSLTGNIQRPLTGPAGAPLPGAAALRELLALVRLTVFLPTDGGRLQGREGAIGLASVLLLAAWIIGEPLLKARSLAFSWYSLPHLAWIGAGALALAWLLARLSTLPVGHLSYGRSLLVTLGAMPLAMAGSLAAEKLAGLPLLLVIAGLSIYALLYFGFALRTLTGRRQWLAVLAGALATGAFVQALDHLRINPSLWIRADENLAALDVAGYEWSRMAGVQFGQQARLDAELATVAAAASPQPEMFFVGFAGYGLQQVFAREIELAAEVVGERFEVGARSLLLANDRLDLEKWPLASGPALDHALRRLGEIMDDDDVLFLALSSHGERDAALKVTNAGLVPTKLRAESLAQMLRESGIRWKIVVVSACYSGSFLDALADERSIVITAAAADRKSFGCDDRRRLTYFGEAFYREALRGGGSMQAAFETARERLEQQERRLGVMPSLPQAHFGALIQARLDGTKTASP